MSNVSRATLIVENIVDHTVTGPLLGRIADAFTAYRPEFVEAIAVDPENPTAEEKAGVFLMAVQEWGKVILDQTAKRDAQASNEATVIAAGASAQTDLD